jgi:23S rRNA (cytosine1962-C5)-methyltransferase
MRHFPTVKIKPRQARRARAGAPWIFSNEIAMNAEIKALAPGALVNVSGDDGHVFGTGFFNPASLIALRLIDPRPDIDPDADFFTARLKRAQTLREDFATAPYYRLVNAEGDYLPGLVIDRFDDVLAVQITSAGMEARIEPLLAALDALLAPAAVVLKADSPARKLEGLELYVRVAKGEAGRISVAENGVGYFADLGAGQKTGWYYDQRDNRAFIAALAKGKSVLDAYCYCGGFALAAAKAGAREAAGIDSSAPALALAEEAAAANGLACAFLKADVPAKLEELAGAGERFDLVVADPPPFVKSRKDLEVGAKAYRKLAKLAANVTAPGGILMLASCSHNISPDRFAAECAAGIQRAGRCARLIRACGAACDHPVHPMLPESAYLKAYTYALD